MLSRVCDAGLDYTQRTNKFAHHVVLDAAETPAAARRGCWQAPALMRSRWEGEPCSLPSGPAVPAGDCPAGVVPRLAAACRRRGLGRRAG